jgi:hypothetical protein
MTLPGWVRPAGGPQIDGLEGAEQMSDIENYDILIIGSGEAGKYLAWTMAEHRLSAEQEHHSLRQGPLVHQACN